MRSSKLSPGLSCKFLYYFRNKNRSLKSEKELDWFLGTGTKK